MIASEDPTVLAPMACSPSQRGALKSLAIMFTHRSCDPRDSIYKFFFVQIYSTTFFPIKICQLHPNLRAYTHIYIHAYMHAWMHDDDDHYDDAAVVYIYKHLLCKINIFFARLFLIALFMMMHWMVLNQMTLLGFVMLNKVMLFLINSFLLHPDPC